jgi:elongator complex protein 5
MAPVNLSHRRTHNLLLISKLLSLRDTASPLTLVLDSLEQPATPLLKEYIRRAKVSSAYMRLGTEELGRRF